MPFNDYADDVAMVIVEQGVRVVTTGAGNPEKYMKMWKEAGVKVIPVVASVALAKRMERCGADAVVAEGCEALSYQFINQLLTGQFFLYHSGNLPCHHASVLNVAFHHCLAESA